MDLRGGDQKAAIRDNLIDFYKRKSRDCSADGSLDGIPVSMSSGSLGSSRIAQSPSHSSPVRSPMANMGMHRIQSER